MIEVVGLVDQVRIREQERVTDDAGSVTIAQGNAQRAQRHAGKVPVHAGARPRFHPGKAPILEEMLGAVILAKSEADGALITDPILAPLVTAVAA